MNCHDEKARDKHTQVIRAWNDRLRQTGRDGKMVMTCAVAQLPAETQIRVLAAVRGFEDFTAANDPWGEHDFGQVVIDGEAYFWKIDAYDINLEYGSPDPADETVTRRVLIIMTAGDL